MGGGKRNRCEGFSRHCYGGFSDSDGQLRDVIGA